MTKRIAQVVVLLAVGVLTARVSSAAILVSTQGVFSNPNDTFRQQLVFNPVTMGNILTVQTYGYGGSSNAPGGTNAAGSTIVAGGFDPIVGLYAGGINGGGALLGSNDDGTCGPGSGATDAGICFDARLSFNSLAAGTYTVVLSAFSNFPPANESTLFPGGGSFNGRTNAYAIDVVTSSTIPEPMTSVLLGAGLLGLGCLARRKRA